MIGAAAVMAWFVVRISAAGLAGGIRELAARRRVAREST
jgi:hypothetical protein